MTRIVNNFNDNWMFSKPGEAPYPVTLPHTWNNKDGQDGGNDYWRGTAEYTKKFARPEAGRDKRVLLDFPAAAMSAEVILNGVCTARHEGGYSAFRVDITDLLEDENTLTVKVDNSVNNTVYPQKADFTFYGGLYRGVNLYIADESHFELIKDGSDGIKVTPVVDLDKKCAEVTVETWNSEAEELVLEIVGTDLKKTIALNGETYHKEVFVINDVRLWDGLRDPYLYTLKASLVNAGVTADESCVRFGCRQFAVDPEKGFILNGRSYPLRGVSRHQDRIGLGNALTYKEHCEDMDVLLDIGANSVRLAHYQHAQEFYDLCDEKGVIAWAEIPYITQHMSGGKKNAVDQMREMITQCYNHPSIICWGLSNEITASSQVNEELIRDHKELNELCHRMDSTRPTVMAHAFMLEKDSELIPCADLASYNLYFGWYLGELNENDEFFDEYHAMYPDRAIGFSEYGADANCRFHSAKPEQGDYTEEYQCVYHEHILKCIDERPYLWSTYVWNLFDFAADGRDEGGKLGENQKGLVEFDHKTKKDAYYLYKAAWSSEPFIHLCGKRFKDRTGDKTEVKVYTNQNEVTLLCDGKEVCRKEGNRVFTFEILLTGEHHIEAVSGDLRDEAVICKVEKDNPEYHFGDAGAVTNWFDKEDINPEYYSIKDTMGALLQNTHTAQVVQSIMAKASASRGDVAKSTGENKALQAMLAKMPFESLLKKAGANVIPAEAVKQINEMLQKVKK